MSISEFIFLFYCFAFYLHGACQSFMINLLSTKLKKIFLYLLYFQAFLTRFFFFFYDLGSFIEFFIFFPVFFFKFYFIFKLYITVLVLPNIKMNPPQVYMCSPS